MKRRNFLSLLPFLASVPLLSRVLNKPLEHPTSGLPLPLTMEGIATGREPFALWRRNLTSEEVAYLEDEPGVKVIQGHNIAAAYRCSA